MATGPAATAPVADASSQTATAGSLKRVAREYAVSVLYGCAHCALGVAGAGAVVAGAAVVVAGAGAPQ